MLGNYQHLLNFALERILNDVPVEFAFWFCNGTIARNIFELKEGILYSPDSVFLYHASPEKDDFAKWILEVLGDNVLAAALKKVKDKQRYVEIIEDRIEEITQKLSKG